uniref:MFS domain-containing protein n=1 Tax=Caenorhabditis tropicalis TaxID=1561998 RepID=A0A1I7UW19_9PELO
MVRVSVISRPATIVLDDNGNEKNEFSASEVLDQLETDWRSMWISIFLQFVVGVQVSVYYMSMWPYLQKLDKSADVDFLGWIIASCNIGSTISNPIYGYWNQRTMSVKMPVIVGFLIAALAQTWYALLSLFPDAKWFMLAARVITGLGVGNIAALRIYAATASTPKDRMKAISYGTGGYVLGISFGPVLSAFFTPLGENGWKLGSIHINMFTTVAFLMTIVCLVACVVVQLFFKENYVGIIDENEKDLNVVIPKYDMYGALICIYLFMVVNIIATNIEVMSTPLTTVLYDWKDSQSILYNGIALCCSCVVSVLLNVILGSTRLGKLDKRIQLLIGIGFFLLYQVFMYPWGFYSGPLDFLPNGKDTDVAGGCYQTYEWCKWTTRVPLPIYLICFIVFFGVAFPFVESPSAALYSEILGPRKQGNMQGLFSLGGSLAPVIGSLTSTALFQATGFRYVMVYQAGILVIGAALVMVFYKRLVPLKLKSIKKT